MLPYLGQVVTYHLTAAQKSAWMVDTAPGLIKGLAKVTDGRSALVQENTPVVLVNLELSIPSLGSRRLENIRQGQAPGQWSEI